MSIPLATFGSLMGMDGLLIFMVLLLIFGAKKLPELARGLGQSLNEFKKAREDFEGEIKNAQQEPVPRGAVNRQPYGQDSAPPALTYDTPATVVPSASELALQKQIAELQQKLSAVEAQNREGSSSAI